MVHKIKLGDAEVKERRVLQLCAIEGTVKAFLFPQILELRRRGFDVRTGFQPLAQYPDVELLKISPTKIEFPRQVRLWRVLRAAFQLRSYLRAESVTIVHVHTPSVALASRIFPRWFYGKGTRFFYTVHGYPFLWEGKGWRKRLLQLAERTLSRRTELTLCVSREDYSQAKEDRRFKGEIRYIGPGLPDSQFQYCPVPPIEDQVRVLFVGRLVEEKGLLDLIHSLSLTSNVYLSLVGSNRGERDKDFVATLTTAIEALGVGDKCLLLGQLPHSQVLEQIRNSHAVILPSYREGVPYSLIEAMASGRPIITTDVRGCRELVRDGQNGFMVPPRAPVILAEALNKFACLAHSEIQEMGTQAFQQASTSYRLSDVIERLEKAYLDHGVVPSLPAG